MNIFEFNNVVYKKNNLILRIYLYYILKNSKLIFFIPIYIWYLFLYFINIKNKKLLIDELSKVNNIDLIIKEFWDREFKNINSWFLNKKNKNDIIVTDYPLFLFNGLVKKIGIKKIINYDKNLNINNYYVYSLDNINFNNIDNIYLYNGKKDIKVNSVLDYKKFIKIDKFIYLFGLMFLVIPIIIQLFFWYKRFISIPLIMFLIISSFMVYKNYKPIEEVSYKKIFNKKKILYFLLFILIINLLSGAGAFVPQNWDYNGRNAIFRDLIEHSWPVKYDYNNLSYEKSIIGNFGLLNYYFAFWLPGALVGKITNFEVASKFMFLWQFTGVSLFFYYLFRYMKNIKYRYFFIFLAFGGLNAIGYFLIQYHGGNIVNPIGTEHIDTSMQMFCMSSFITQLFWVFNQSVPAWIITLLFLQDNEYKHYGYYFGLLVPYGPLPMLGLFYIMFVFIIFGKKLNKFINLDRIKKIISLPNILTSLAIMPILLMYTNQKSARGSFIIDAINNGTLKRTLILYLMFVVLEFLIYIVIINKKNYKELTMIFLFFTIVPLFYFGGGDLANRATIPLLILLYILVLKYLDNIEVKNKFIKIRQYILIFILSIAFITNFNEINRSIKYYYIYDEDKSRYFADNYKSYDNFENKEVSMFISNFVIKYDKKNIVQNVFLRD